MKTNTIFAIALVFAAFLLFTLPVVNAESNLKVSKANLMFKTNTNFSKIFNYKISDNSNYKKVKDISARTIFKDSVASQLLKTSYGYNTRVNVVVKDDAGNPVPNAIVTISNRECHVENSDCLPNTNYLRGYGALTNAQGVATFDFDFSQSYPGITGNNNEQYEIKVPRVVFLDSKFSRDLDGNVGPYKGNTQVYQTFGPDKSAYFNESDLLGNEVTVNFKVLTGSANLSALTKDSLGNDLKATYLPELQNYTAITSTNTNMILDSVKPYAGCVETQKFSVPFDFGSAYAGWNCQFSVSKYTQTTYILNFNEINGSKTATTNVNMSFNQTYNPTVVLN